MHEHRTGKFEGFTKKYKLRKLVYYAQTSDVDEAIKLEKQMKEWKRDWKIELIEKENPEWKDLYPKLIGIEIPDQVRDDSGYWATP